MWLSQSKDAPMAAISLDAENAEKVGLGPCFSRWVKILYQELKAALITNVIIEGDQRNRSGLF